MVEVSSHQTSINFPIMSDMTLGEDCPKKLDLGHNSLFSLLKIKIAPLPIIDWLHNEYGNTNDIIQRNQMQCHKTQLTYINISFQIMSFQMFLND